MGESPPLGAEGARVLPQSKYRKGRPNTFVSIARTASDQKSERQVPLHGLSTHVRLMRMTRRTHGYQVKHRKRERSAPERFTGCFHFD